MKKGKYILIFAFVTMISCSKKNETCRLIGSLENAEDVDYLYLKDVTSNILVDSIKVTDGRIDYEFDLSTPNLFKIHNKRNKYQFRDSKMIWLEPGKVKIIGDFNYLKNISIKGSDSQDEYLKYHTLIDSLNKKIIHLQEEMHIQDKVTNRETIRQKLENFKQTIPQNIIDFLKNNIDSYVTLSTLYAESYYGKRHLNKTEIEEVYELLPDYLRQTKQGNQIKRFIELPPLPKKGNKAIEITQSSPNGDTIKLSDFRGKYVLLEFWSSWCAPCRSSNRNLRKIYSKYNSQGFEILSVSGDKNKDHWIKAIEADSLKWAQISDLKGWHNEAFLSYDIKYVPQNFLISPDGIILGDNYCNVKMLDRELSKLLN